MELARVDHSGWLLRTNAVFLFFFPELPEKNPRPVLLFPKDDKSSLWLPEFSAASLGTEITTTLLIPESTYDVPMSIVSSNDSTEKSGGGGCDGMTVGGVGTGVTLDPAAA
jgi:hypothetical protein